MIIMMLIDLRSEIVEKMETERQRQRSLRRQSRREGVKTCGRTGHSPCMSQAATESMSMLNDVYRFLNCTIKQR